MNSKSNRKFKIIDLSLPVLPTLPGSMVNLEIQYIDHKQGAKIYGNYFGLKEEDFPDGNFSAVENVTLTTQSGAHLDAPWHYWPTSEGRPVRWIDEVPLEWCYGDGVILNMNYKKAGEEIEVKDLEKAD